MHSNVDGASGLGKPVPSDLKVTGQMEQVRQTHNWTSSMGHKTKSNRIMYAMLLKNLQFLRTTKTNFNS